MLPLIGSTWLLCAFDRLLPVADWEFTPEESEIEAACAAAAEGMASGGFFDRPLPDPAGEDDAALLVSPMSQYERAACLTNEAARIPLLRVNFFANLGCAQICSATGQHQRAARFFAGALSAAQRVARGHGALVACAVMFYDHEVVHGDSSGMRNRLHDMLYMTTEEGGAGEDDLSASERAQVLTLLRRMAVGGGRPASRGRRRGAVVCIDFRRYERNSTRRPARTRASKPRMKSTQPKMVNGGCHGAIAPFTEPAHKNFPYATELGTGRDSWARLTPYDRMLASQAAFAKIDFPPAPAPLATGLV